MKQIFTIKLYQSLRQKVLVILLLFFCSQGQVFAQIAMTNVKIAEGPYTPNWKAVGDRYKAPSWFNNAKFGIWLHWGAQAEGESGDWFAKFMYYPFGDWTNNHAYTNHLKRWGHPSESGYTEVLRSWKAEKWDPDKLMKLYKKIGANYVLILGAHHDNFDNWNSKYQPWNSVNIGPHKDIVGGWVKAAKKEHMRYGISFHADYSWWWYQAAFRSDTSGPKKGLPYDAGQNLSGKNKWWAGMNLQDLYGKDLRNEMPAGTDPRTDFFSNVRETFKDTAFAKWYCTKWCLRVRDLIDQFQPDILYFDGSTYPFAGKGTGRGYHSDATIRMAAHLYNQSLKANNGEQNAMLFAKGYEDPRAISSTYESGIPDTISSKNAWMAENSIGEWFYQPNTYYSAGMAIHQMTDAFSLGGNYTLNLPMRPDGTYDAEAVSTLEEIGVWMRTNSEAIYGSHAWIVHKEGSHKVPNGNLKQANDIKFSSSDIRFTTNHGNLYAFVLAVPADKKVIIKSLSLKSGNQASKISGVSILGLNEKLKWAQTDAGLEVNFKTNSLNKNGFVVKIRFDKPFYF